SRFAGREMARLGSGVGALYAVNTFGAVLGSFLTGFVLLEAIGVSRSVYLAASVGILVGLVAVLAGRKAGFKLEAEPAAPAGACDPATDRSAQGEPLTRYAAMIVLVSYALSGAAALGYEVLYTKVLIFSIGLSAHAFSVMLTTFLVGLALGSLVASRWVDRSARPIEALAIVEMLIGGTVLLSIYLLRELDLTHRYLAIKDAGGDLARLRGADFLQSAMVMFAPTLLMGAAFPMVAKIYTRRNLVSSSVGSIYFSNTVGAVAGSLAAGFLLVPLLGSARSMALLAAVNVALGVLLFSCVGRRRAWIGASAAALVALVIVAFMIPPSIFSRTFNIKQPGSQLLYFKEGSSGTVTVHRYPEYDLLAIDGVDVAGTSFMLRVTQKLQAHLPVLLAAEPGRIAHIGFGSGETLRTLNMHQVGSIDGIEICKDVVSTARRFFSAINLNVFDRGNVNITIMDGKNYVLLTRKTYDIIMTDSIYPGSGGASALYTVDHFKKVRERLNPGGIASCWLPLDIARPDLASALMAFNQAFPDMSVWYCYMGFSQHALLVGAKEGPARIDMAAFAGAFAQEPIRDDLASIRLDSPFAMVSCFLADGEAVRRFCAGIPANSDDRPSLEFGTARRGTSRTFLAGNLQEMLALRPNPMPYVVNLGGAGMDSASAAAEMARHMLISSNIMAGHLQYASGEIGQARAQYERALMLDPANRIAQASIADLEAASSSLERAVRASGDDYVAVYRLGVQYLGEGKLDQALASLEKAVALRPDLVDPYVSLGECYQRLGKPEKALDYFVNADKIKPGNDGILLRLGLTYDQLGRKAEARRSYQEAAAANPDNYDARNNLGLVLLGEGDIAGARREFEHAVKVGPGRPYGICNLGLTYAYERDWRRAEGYYREALRLAPNFYPACYYLGDALEALGDSQGAVEAWRRTLELKPDHAGARQKLSATRP
ncbi:MAG: fused MFS/spermidine synthase, partial [bacterium]